MLGPGILYAAMAVGVSHLVQSTRAGAVYGLAMATFIVVIVIVKYPGLCFGAQYTAATGKSLPENYLEQGWWAAALYLGSTLFGMWFALAAITLTTAGLVLSVAGLQMDALPVSGGLLAVTAALLIAGRYQWLESLSKLLVLLLALLVIVATALALPRVTWQAERFVLSEFDAAAALFVVAMVGWMPTPMEGALLTSVWTRSRQEDRGLNVSAQASRFDFNVGYVVALVLALGFLVLGVAVMYEPGINPENSPGGFTSQVIRLFTETMGGWAFYIIGACALAAMFTTLL